MEAIMEANSLANANKIITGQKLVIPVPAQPAPTSTPTASPTPS
jgi:LysM repeat protein